MMIGYVLLSANKTILLTIHLHLNQEELPDERDAGKITPCTTAVIQVA